MKGSTWILLAAAAALLGGCVTTGYRQADGYYVGDSAASTDTVYPDAYGNPVYDPFYGSFVANFGYGYTPYGSPWFYPGDRVRVYRHDRDRRRDDADRPRPLHHPDRRWSPPTARIEARDRAYPPPVQTARRRVPTFRAAPAFRPTPSIRGFRPAPRVTAAAPPRRSAPQHRAPPPHERRAQRHPRHGH